MVNYLLRHLQVLLDSIGRLARAPLPTLISVSVLGIAIALPLVLYHIADSVNRIANQWQGQSEISVFLHSPKLVSAAASATAPAVELDIDTAAINFAESLLHIPTIDDIKYVSPEQALRELRAQAAIGSALDGLTENPLPPLLLIYPQAELTLSEVQQLVEQILARAEVDSASFDLLWRQRLKAILQLLKRGLVILSLLMGVGVVLLVSYTVRLAILQRSEEIEIIEQIGGSRAFIRRPFLYIGALQGLCGALGGYALGRATLFLLGKPVTKLAALYHSEFRLAAIEAPTLLAVVGTSVLLGWIAAWLTLHQYLKKSRPG